MLRTLKSDPVVKLFALILLAVCLPYIIPSLDDLRPIAHYYGEFLLLGCVVFALQHGLKQIEEPRERRFWNLLSVAFCCWIIGIAIMRLNLPLGWAPRIILSDVFYALFYLSFLLAAEQGALAGKSADIVRLIRTIGFALFVAGLLFYFVLIPGLERFNPNHKYLPSYYFYLAVDIVAAIRFAQLQRATFDPRWRVLYGLTAVAALQFFLLDLLELMHDAGIWDADWGSYTDPVWDIPMVVMVAVARLRHHRFPAAVQPIYTLQKSDRSPLIIMAFVIPILHFVVSFTGLIGPDLHQYQEPAALIIFVILGSLAVVEHDRLQKQSLKAQEALRISEERFRLVSYAIKDVTWEWKVGTNEIVWSPNVQEVFGYSADSGELDLAGWAEKIHDDDRRRILARMEEEMRTRQKFAATEYRFRRKDGSYAYVLDRSCLLFDESGKPDRMIGTTMDITDRKHAEKELQQSLSLLRATLESTVDGILVVDSTGKITSHNQRFKDMWNIPDSILQSKDDQKAISFVLSQLKFPEDFLRKVRDLYESPAAESFDVLYFKDGRVFERYSKPQWVGEESVGRVRSFHDVTERFKAESAIRQSEERYRTLFEESRDVVFISSTEGKVIDINQAGVELFGFSTKEELLQTNIARDLYMNPDDRRSYEELLAKQGYVKDFQLTLKKRTGEKLIVLETSTAMEDENGRVIAYRGIMRDVTELKHMERELIQSQKMETIGRLAGGVAHDFNNLLMAISGYSELVLMKLPADHSVRQDVMQISKAAEQGAALTRQLLAFGRKQMLAPAIVDINRTVDDLNGMLRRLIGDHIELITSLQAAPPHIYADPVQVEQVILNLAVNARDAMAQGGELIVETTNVCIDDEFAKHHAGVVPGEYVSLTVRDTGHGMDAETVAHVFEPFFTTKETGKGTGLGLSTVYGIIKQSGGHISVSSQPGKGSSFRIYLPLAKEDVREADVRVCKTLQAPESPVTVLLVDDNENVRATIGQFLNRQGYSVLQAACGLEAIDIFTRQKDEIALLITDVSMPKMSGPQLAERLTGVNSALKVLFISGFAEEAVLHQMQLGPGASFISKPVTMASLLNKTFELLQS